MTSLHKYFIKKSMEKNLGFTQIILRKKRTNRIPELMKQNKKSPMAHQVDLRPIGKETWLGAEIGLVAHLIGSNIF